MAQRKKPNEDGTITCPRCGESKEPHHFNRADSYCKVCRKAYALDYHARRRTEDPTFLAKKAAKAKKKYQQDPRARLARLESARKYRHRQRQETGEGQKEAKERWDDLK